MIKTSILVLAALFASCISGYQVDHMPKQTKPVIFPLPHTLTHGDQSLFLDQCNFNVEINDKLGKDFVESISSHFLKEYFPNQEKACQNNEINPLAKLNKLKITINKDITEKLPKSIEDTDESYSISIPEDASEIHLQANQYAGIVRGLSTIEQIIKKSKEQPSLHQVNFLPLQINDSPRYPYRGLMIDTSRHYLKVSTIKGIISVLSASKFSVLHWHLVDDDSFPAVLDSYPTISAKAAFSSSSVYTKANMNDIVAYAQNLAIRVIPEFDNPGHVRAIGNDPTFKDIIRCFNTDQHYTVPNAYRINAGPPTGAMDPSYDLTYDLLRGIFTDFNAIFTDSMIHLGGDEIFTSCFDENPGIKAFMVANDIATYNDLIVYHMLKARDILEIVNKDKQAIYWSNEDTLYQEYRDSDVLMWWGHSNAISQFKQTYPNNKVIFAPSDYYYLDCGYGNPYGGNSWCDPFKTWWTIYQFEPSVWLNDGSVLGGEVAAWSELFGDDNIHTRIWPRAGAMADKLWGPVVPTDLVALVNRQTAFSELANDKGIPTTPVTSTWCEINSDHCFGKYVGIQDKIEEIKQIIQ